MPSACLVADFRHLEGGIPPRGQDHLSRVHIAIVRCAAARAIPTSYSKTCDTFRAADASAVGTGLGTPSLIDMDTHCLPSGSFVRQHMPEARPARVEYGFSHPRLSNLGSVHVAYCDQTILVGNPSGLFVEVVPPRVCDLGVYRFRTPHVSGPLGLREPRFVKPVVLDCGDDSSVAAGGKRLKSEVNPDFAVAGGQVVLNLALEGDVPAATGILNEGARLVLSLDVATSPKAEPALEIGSSVPVDFHGARDKRNPSKGSPLAKARSEARAFAMLVARLSKPLTNSGNSIGVKPEFRGATSSQPNEVKAGESSGGQTRPVAPLSLALSCRAEIPNLITGNRVAVEKPSDRAIFDPKLECDDAQVEPFTLTKTQEQ